MYNSDRWNVKIVISLFKNYHCFIRKKNHRNENRIITALLIGKLTFFIIKNSEFGKQIYYLYTSVYVLEYKFIKQFKNINNRWSVWKRDSPVMLDENIFTLLKVKVCSSNVWLVNSTISLSISCLFFCKTETSFDMCFICFSKDPAAPVKRWTLASKSVRVLFVVCIPSSAILWYCRRDCTSLARDILIKVSWFSNCRRMSESFSFDLFISVVVGSFINRALRHM